MGGAAPAAQVARADKLSIGDRPHSHSLSLCRLLSVSLVSQRFRALCLDPLLTREVSIALYDQTDLDATLRSLHSWLAVNAQHLTSFSMDVEGAVDPALFMGCLIACCAAAPLVKLRVAIDVDMGMPTLAWLLSVRSTLRQLELNMRLDEPFCLLTIDTPLQQCTALASLMVWCKDLVFEPGAALPRSLTSLELKFLNGLPSQVCLLTIHLSCQVVVLLRTPLHALHFRFFPSLS